MRSRHVMLVFAAAAALPAQDMHNHAREVHGVPGGVPEFCASPTASSAASGAWSDASTWSSKKVPSDGDRVSISAGHNVVYEVASDARLACIDVRGHLSFSTDANTRMRTGNIMVLDEGYLEV